MKLVKTISGVLGAAVLSPLLLTGQAYAATGQQIADLANANQGKMACDTNSLGGLYFLSSCTGNGGRPEYWCADFAKWVWMNAGGINTANLTPAARSFYSYGAGAGTLSNTPHVGDAAVFSDTNSAADIDHVGIVTAVNSNGTVAIQNGNYGGQDGDQAHFAGTSRVVPTTINATVGTYSSSQGYYLVKYVRPVGVTEAVASKADLLRVNGDGSLTVWQNNDALAGRWNAPVNAGNIGTTEQFRSKLGDLNGDGNADLIRVNADGSLTAWRNNDALSGAWAAPATVGNVGGGDATRVRLTDLNGDGRADMVVVNMDGSMTAWQNNGVLAGGGWSAPRTIGNVGTTDQNRVRFGDLNGDGRDDLVRVNADGSLTAWQNNNALAGSWAAPGTIGNAGTANATRVRLGDLNADGRDDLIRMNDDGSLVAWRNNNALAGSWAAPSTIGNAGTADPSGIEFADLG
ncbi:VCBS repeat protein [Lentzea atacamensis]|uniref:VCBS repeat protein n=1 Tax=Lentzea atacamensis TaxID=531938 RepID=A0A316I2H5_9PSEU|nr:FG-GAP-like repeat-containing protein [Lentzea atacamensis]PWK86520.1 VCBS repeat protein [Lentzea atacamensis]